MRPEKGKDVLQIPITFDTKSGYRVYMQAKPFWVFLLVVVWIFTAVLALIVGEGFWRWGYPVLSFILLIYIIRFVIVREDYFRRKRKELVENNFMFPYSIFWNIYEISSKYPYFVRFGNGLKGIFVAMDKDVIIGKEEDNDYNHYEAIANAYQQMVKRGIECVHIDLMETVGKDGRLDELFRNVDRVSNPDLKKVLLRLYDHVDYMMDRSYASYDIYCFYYAGREDLFWDELQVVLSYFKEANYIRTRILDRDDIAELTRSLFGIEDFSVVRACDDLFKELNRIQYIRTIWVERNGERFVLNKTLEEIEEEKRVARSERKVKKKVSYVKKNFRNKKKVEEESIDLFD